MNIPFLSRRSLFGAPNALLILLVVFFLVPFAIRGARLSLRKTENNVKDWLPADFRETSELQWFGRYFAGERFILATWEGCSEDDQRLHLLSAKLRAESAAGRSRPSSVPDFERAQALANELGLLLPSELHRNWGGQNEIWLTSTHGEWYYFTPEGNLFRWLGRSDTVGGTIRGVKRLISGPFVEGKFVTALGATSSSGAAVESASDPLAINPYYNNPALLTLPLIATVQTGPELAEELSLPGGAFYPVDLTDAAFKPIVAKRRAMEQLTGTLFAKAIPDNFEWTPQAFLEQIPVARRELLPANFIASAEITLQSIASKQFDGDESKIKSAASDVQTAAWYAVYDDAGVEPPARQAGVLLTLTQAGQEHLPFLLGRGVLGAPRGRLLCLAEEAGLSAAPAPIMAPPPLDRLVQTPAPTGPELHMGGPPVDNVAIDEEGSITLVRLVGYCAALGLFLSYICFRNIKITVMIFFVGGVAAMTSLSLVWWSGSAIDAILMSMPSLVYVLGLSSAIHIVNYYREEVVLNGVIGAPGRALKHGWGPCFLASFTTAIGLLSLYTSNIVPIRKFGLFSALGVMATLAILFAYLPAALEVFVPRMDEKKKKSSAKKDEPTSNDDEPTSNDDEPKVGVGMMADAWECVGRWIVDHHAFVAIGCTVILIVAACGLPRIKTSVQLLKLFGAQSRIISDYAWLEKHYAKLVPMELVVRIPEEMLAEEVDAGRVAAQNSVYPLARLERLEAIDHIQRTVASAFGEQGKNVVGQAMSAASLAPPLPDPASGFSLERKTFNRMLNDKVDEIIASDYLRIEEDGPFKGSELWRISLRVGALSDVDYGQFVNDLRVAVSPVLEAYRYRGQILDAVAASGDNRPKVLVLGRGVPLDVGLEPVLFDHAADAKATADSITESIDTQSIFASTLKELMENTAVGKLRWDNPSRHENALAISKDPNWGKAIAGFSAVVLLNDHQAYDVDFIRQHAKTLIDARNISTDRAVPLVVDEIPIVEDSGPLQVVYTGVVPVVYKAQRTLLESLVQSIAWAFVLIAGVMAVLLNPGRPILGMLRPGALAMGCGAGAVAMLPNIFPVVLVFGTMGYADLLVDIGTMMTASVAMGIAVDDTIHFLAWLRRGLNDGLNRHDALIQTYRRVGPAMAQTTLVGGLGLFVFALSTFTPTQRFGTLMLVLLVSALFGDLIFLPALLAGPLGRFFKPRPVGPDPKPLGPHSGAMDSTQDDESTEINEELSGNVGRAPVKPPKLVNHSRVDRAPH